jgi:ATP-binding cassette, subfamily B, bacterial
MKLLFDYLIEHKKTLGLTLFLAAINQIFSLLDPQFFRLIIDKFTGDPSLYTQTQFFGGIAVLLAGSVGVAFVPRVAKNFQDYYTNVISLRVGASLYTDTIKHAFALPYSIFEDERSGELLNKLKQARDNAQALIGVFVGSVFISIIGIVFVLVYAFIVHWSVGLLYFAVIPIIGVTTFLIGRKIKTIQLAVVRESSALAGSTTETIRNVELVKSLGLEDQEVSRLHETNDKILELEFKKQQSIRVLSFIQGTLINAVRAGLLFLMLFLIYKGSMTVGELFSLFIYSFYIFSPLQEMVWRSLINF